MIGKSYVTTMARYNRWQNQSLYAAAGRLDDAARRLARGAFFGSIHATLNHLLWGDHIWMSRLAATPKPRATSIPESLEEHPSWDDLKRERAAFDEVIADWARALDPAWLAGDLTWFSGAKQRELTKPRSLLVTHMFNHQTHHRGQVHAMLTAAGEHPEDTDLPLTPDEAT
jgi:uncharacterized damage-inducible protein DinB